MSDAHILITRVDHANVALTPARLARLTRAEQQRVDTFYQNADRVRFVVGRSLLRRGLHTLYGISEASMSEGPNGKPQLADTKLNIDVSLAHGGNIVVCGFVRDAIIGVDVEPIDRTWNVMEVADAQFAPSERAALLRLDERDRCDAFFRLWALKEAVVKATGLGLTIAPDSFAVALDPPRLCGSERALGDIMQWRFAEWRINDARLAVALHGSRVEDVVLSDVPLSAALWRLDHLP